MIKAEMFSRIHRPAYGQEVTTALNSNVNSRQNETEIFFFKTTPTHRGKSDCRLTYS
jgi:hypothetical protein